MQKLEEIPRPPQRRQPRNPSLFSTFLVISFSIGFWLLCVDRTSGGITRKEVFSLGQRNEGLGNSCSRTPMSSRQIRVTAIAISVRRQTPRCVNQSTSYSDLNPKMQSKNFYQVRHCRPALQFADCDILTWLRL